MGCLKENGLEGDDGGGGGGGGGGVREVRSVHILFVHIL